MENFLISLFSPVSKWTWRINFIFTTLTMIALGLAGLPWYAILFLGMCFFIGVGVLFVTYDSKVVEYEATYVKNYTLPDGNKVPLADRSLDFKHQVRHTLSCKTNQSFNFSSLVEKLEYFFFVRDAIFAKHPLWVRLWNGQPKNENVLLDNFYKDWLRHLKEKLCLDDILSAAKTIEELKGIVGQLLQSIALATPKGQDNIDLEIFWKVLQRKLCKVNHFLTFQARLDIYNPLKAFREIVGKKNFKQYMKSSTEANSLESAWKDLCKSVNPEYCHEKLEAAMETFSSSRSLDYKVSFYAYKKEALKWTTVQGFEDICLSGRFMKVRESVLRALIDRAHKLPHPEVEGYLECLNPTYGEVELLKIVSARNAAEYLWINI